MESIPIADDLIEEYLLFRGFTKTLHQFQEERSQDRAKGFSADKLVQHFVSLIHEFDADALVMLWKYLDSHFFSRLDGFHKQTIISLRQALFRLYLVSAKQRNNLAAINAFLSQHCSLLIGYSQDDKGFEVDGSQKDLSVWLNSLGFPQNEKRDTFGSHQTREYFDLGTVNTGMDLNRHWFSLPFISEPEKDPYFFVFFSLEWQEKFILSLRNFLSSVFQHMPLPKLLSFDLIHLHVQELNCRLQAVLSDHALLEWRLNFLNESNSSSKITCQNEKLQEKESTQSTPSAIQQEATNSLQNTGNQVTRNMPSTTLLRRRQSKSKTCVRVLQSIPVYFGESRRISDGWRSTAASVCKFAPVEEATHVAISDGGVAVHFWRLQRDNSWGAFHRNFLLTPSTVTCMAWENFGGFLFVGTEEGNIQVWDVETMTMVNDFMDSQFAHDQTSSVTCISNSPNGISFASGLADSSFIRIWDIRSGKVENRIDCDVSGSGISSIGYNHNGTMLAAGCDSGSICILDVSRGSSILRWETNMPCIDSCMFDTTETIILCSSRNGLTMEWSTHAVGVLVTQYGENSHERISQIPPQSSYSADSEHIFCVNQDVVDIYRVGVEDKVAELAFPHCEKIHSLSGLDLAFIDEQDSLVVAGNTRSSNQSSSMVGCLWHTRIEHLNEDS